MKIFEIKAKAIVILFFLTLFLSCLSNNSLVGKAYSSEGFSPVEKLNFVSSSKVEMVSMMATVEAEYEIERNKVKISNAGQTLVLTINEDGKCLEGNGLFGKFCK